MKAAAQLTTVAGPDEKGLRRPVTNEHAAASRLFLAAPIACKGRLVQYAGGILRPFPDRFTAEVHHYHDVATGVLGSSLGERIAGLHQRRLSGSSTSHPAARKSG